MQRIVLLASLASCAVGAADVGPTPVPPPAPIAPAPIAPAPVAPTADLHRFVAVKLDGLWQECSGAGGEHLALALPGGGHAHAGGHAQWLGLTHDQAPTMTPEVLVDRWYVAELTMRSRTTRNAGWCLGTMPVFSAEAIRLWDAADRADAESKAAHWHDRRDAPAPTYTAPGVR